MNTPTPSALGIIETIVEAEPPTLALWSPEVVEIN